MTQAALPSLVPGFGPTRDTLHLVAVHIVARARVEATARFGLRAAPGGFGTPAFGGDAGVVRVSGAYLVVERAGPDSASQRAAALDGATPARLATVAGVDLGQPLDVGHDTPEPPPTDTPLVVDPTAADQLATWFAFVDRVLVELASARPHTAPTAIQLWPEHFDLAIDLAAGANRANVGGSPGDSFHPEPYLYVGPWGSDRPGDPSYWSAPFGAVLGYRDLAASPDPVARALEFIDRGLTLLDTSSGVEPSVQ